MEILALQVAPPSCGATAEDLSALMSGVDSRLADVSCFSCGSGGVCRCLAAAVPYRHALFEDDPPRNPLAGLTFKWDDAATYSPARSKQRELERMLLQFFDIDPQYFTEKYKTRFSA